LTVVISQYATESLAAVCRQNSVTQQIQAINAVAGTGSYAIKPVP
jgi:hypothetical protein